MSLSLDGPDVNLLRKLSPLTTPISLWFRLKLALNVTMRLGGLLRIDLHTAFKTALLISLCCRFDYA